MPTTRREGGLVSGFEEPHVAWRKSTKSDSGGCVELAAAAGSVLVRDSRNRSGTVLRFPSAAWSAFVGYARGTDPGPGPA
jgi:Domain of unknown function (DUF397)